MGGAGSLQGATRGRTLSGIRQLCMLGLWKDMQAQGIEVQRLEWGVTGTILGLGCHGKDCFQLD